MSRDRGAELRLTRRQEITEQYRLDALGAAFHAAHAAIIAYVCVGWLIPSRPALYAYLLLLPLIALQWLLNGGVSLVNNMENLARVGRWRDPANIHEGAFFKTLLGRMGIRANQGQILLALLSIMLSFWLAAFYRMVMIEPVSLSAPLM